jgi:hypothetical protein
MTIYYVSKSGNNANDGLTLANAKRTLWDSGANNGAHEAAADGDTILFDDGIYSGSEIELSAALGYTLNPKGVKFDSVNPFGATLASTVATAVFRINGAFASKSLSFGKINIDGDTVTPNYGVWFAPTSGPATLDMGEAVVKKSAFYSVYVNAANTVQVIVKDNASDLTATRNPIDATTLGASSSITLSGTKCRTTSKTVARPAINIIATAAGCSAQVLEPIITIAHDATFPVQGDGGILIKNIDNALIYKPSVTVTTASANGTIVGAQIDCDSATLTAHRGSIIGGSFNLDANGGIGAVYGHDTSNAGDNRCNFGLIRGVKVNGGSKFIAGLGHAVMLGNAQDGFAAGNEVNGAGIGCLLKATTRGRFNANKMRACASTYIQVKGCADSTSDGNEIFMDDSAGIGINANANGAVNSSNCTVTGNILHVNVACTGKLVAIETGQGVTMSQNIYNVLAAASIPATPFTVGASNYTTIDTYLAAQETTGKKITDRVISLSTGGGSASGLYLEVAPGVNLPL